MVLLRSLVLEGHAGEWRKRTGVPLEVHAEQDSHRNDPVRPHPTPTQPLQSLRFAYDRIRSIFLAGAPFTVAVILIPLRFQNVNNLSPLDAGIRLLPYAVANPLGSVLAPVLAGRFKIPPIYMLFVGAMIQIAGFSLLSIAPDSLHPAPAQYGYEVLAGFGTGINLASLIVITPFAVEKRDKCEPSLS